MATLIANTTSNGAAVSDEQALQAVLDKWDFIPHHGSLTVEVDDEVLNIYGEAEFEPYPVDGVPDEPVGVEMYDAVDVAGFLEAIVDYLDEPLVIHEIGREKLRFPFNAVQYIADPVSGEVNASGFYDKRREWLDSVRADE